MDELIKNEPKQEASYLMRNDYMNEYTHLFHLLLNTGRDGQIILSQNFNIPRGFTARYQGKLEMTADSVAAQKIKILDELAVTVNKLIKEVPINKAALLDVMNQVAEICNRRDMVGELKRVFDE